MYVKASQNKLYQTATLLLDEGVLNITAKNKKPSSQKKGEKSTVNERKSTRHVGTISKLEPLHKKESISHEGKQKSQNKNSNIKTSQTNQKDLYNVTPSTKKKPSEVFATEVSIVKKHVAKHRKTPKKVANFSAEFKIQHSPIEREMTHPLYDFIEPDIPLSFKNPNNSVNTSLRRSTRKSAISNNHYDGDGSLFQDDKVSSSTGDNIHITPITDKLRTPISSVKSGKKRTVNLARDVSSLVTDSGDVHPFKTPEIGTFEQVSLTNSKKNNASTKISSKKDHSKSSKVNTLSDLPQTSTPSTTRIPRKRVIDLCPPVSEIRRSKRGRRLNNETVDASQSNLLVNDMDTDFMLSNIANDDISLMREDSHISKKPPSWWTFCTIL